MAKAESTKAIVTVTLTLNGDEAATLRDIVMNIGGCPDKSRRKHADAIGAALDAAGIRWTDHDDIRSSSCIYFEG